MDPTAVDDVVVRGILIFGGRAVALIRPQVVGVNQADGVPDFVQSDPHPLGAKLTLRGRKTTAHE